MRALVLLLLLSGRAWGVDPLEIIRKAVNHDQSNWRKAKEYTYIVRSEMRVKDSKGNVKKVDKRAEEVLVLYGEPYDRLIEKDGTPLSESEQRKEQQKLDKLIEKREKESPAERQKRLAEFDREREKDREYIREIPDAFRFRLLGEETAAGRRCWVIEAAPREDFQPKHSRAGILKKFQGKLWIDEQEFQLVRLDVEAIDTVSWGLALARLAKGSRVFFEQHRINDEVWMPYRVEVNLDARLALVKRLQGDFEMDFANFRKFQTDSRIVDAAELK